MKKNLCRWLYNHHMKWLARKISESITFMIEAENICNAFRCGLTEGSGEHRKTISDMRELADSIVKTL